MHMKSVVAIALLAAADVVVGHGAIIKAVGDAGGQGSALGIDSSTPRDGTRRNPFQQDSTRFKGDAAQTFGETVGAGSNQLEAGTKAIMAESGQQLPQITAGGSVQMTLHQVNADGGGPYTCEMDMTGTGNNFQSVKVTTTPPGQNSRNRQGAMTDFPLVAAVPSDAACTGTVAGQQNVCLVRCMNAARAGPFGGVVPVQMAGAQTPAQARRALALSMKRTEETLYNLRKRANVADADDLSPEEIAELKADGEI